MTTTTFNLSHDLVRSWSPCADGYRWFLSKFPQGGPYTAVHEALREDSRFEDADWLFRAALAHALSNDPAVTTDLVASQSDEAAKIIEATDPEKLEVPDAARIGSSGYDAQIGSSGDDARIGSSGDAARIGSSGDAAQIGSSGDDARIGSSGDAARIGSSGYAAQIGSSGDAARIGSSGYAAQIGSSGNYAWIGSSGDDARIGSSGDAARIGSSGYDAWIGSSGDAARINAAGERAVIACVGVGAKAKAGTGGAVALAYQDEAGRTRFAVGYVGENIAADTWYRVNGDGEFVEVGA